MNNTTELQNRQSALLVAMLTSFMGPFMISAVNIALPAIGKTFDIDAILMSWVVNSFLLATSIGLVPSGRLADIYGRKKIFKIGLWLFTLGTLLCWYSTNIYTLIISRAIQGLGSSMTMTTGTAILMSVYPKEMRGRVLGINVAAVYVGLSTGPFVGGMLTQQFGWESIFAVSAIIGFVGIIIATIKLKGEWAEAAGQSFDFIGTFIYAACLISLVLAAAKLPDIIGLALITFSVLMLIFFLIYENRIKYPVFEIKLFRNNRLFAFSNIAALINYCATFAISFLLSLYLQYAKGFTPQQAGIVLVAQPIMQVLLSPFAGKLSDRKDPGRLASLGMSITALGLFVFIFIDMQTPLWLFIANLTMLGVGFAFFSSPNMNTIMSSVDRQYYGIASGSASTMRLLGQMVSMSIATLLFATIIGHEQIDETNIDAFIRCLRYCFIIFFVLCFIGVYFSSVRGKLRISEKEETKNLNR